MYSDAVPEALRHIHPLLKRADELRTQEPVISYYCKFYFLPHKQSELINDYLRCILCSNCSHKKRLSKRRRLGPVSCAFARSS